MERKCGTEGCNEKVMKRAKEKKSGNGCTDEKELERE